MDVREAEQVVHQAITGYRLDPAYPLSAAVVDQLLLAGWLRSPAEREAQIAASGA